MYSGTNLLDKLCGVLKKFFSDFWYQGSFLWYLEDYKAGFFERKKFLVKNGEKGVKNMHFRARLGNQSIDFSDFWYKTSLIYYFKYGTLQEEEKIGPKMAKRGDKYAFSSIS